MFGLEDDDVSGREKCYTTVAQLPEFIDPKQPPTKKSPFSTILSHPLVHTVPQYPPAPISYSIITIHWLSTKVEVTLPKKAYSSIESSLNSKLQKLRYARISMTLSSLIDEGFFNTYIKKGTAKVL
jgi:ribonuclease P/MRP protein subunit RPP40